MADLRFTDAGFSATTVDLEPVTDAGRVWFERHFGRAAISATLPKGTGGMEAMAAISRDGLTYTVA